ncbi:DUF6020 family protein [Weissella confusa]
MDNKWLEKIMNNGLFRVIQAIVVALGGNIFSIAYLPKDQIPAGFSGISITPLLFLVTLILFWCLQPAKKHNRAIFGAGFGLVFGVVLFTFGYRNFEPVLAKIFVYKFWYIIGFAGMSIWWANFAMVDWANLKIRISPKVAFLFAPLMSQILIAKPFLLSGDDINLTSLVVSNWLDGVLLSLVVLLLGVINPVKQLKIWQTVVTVVMSGVVTVFYVFGISIDISGDATYFFNHLIYFFMSGLTTWITMFLIIKYLLNFSPKFVNAGRFGVFAWIQSRRFLLIVTVIVWIPYMVLFLPGSLGYDGMNQLAEFFRLHTQDGTNFYPTNHQPWAATLFMGSVVKLGMKLFGSFENGVGFYSLLVVLFALITTTAMTLFAAKRFGNVWGWLTWTIAALLPIFPFWYLTFDKTGIFILAFAWFLMFFATVVFAKESLKVRHFVWLTVFGVVMSLLRNDMIYVVAIVMIYVIVTHKVDRIKSIISAGIIIVSVFAWNSVGLKALEIVPTPSAEMLSVPVQQLARDYATNPSSFDKVERKELKRAFNAQGLPLSDVMAKYNYGLSDNVKGQLTGSEWIWSYTLSKNDDKRWLQVQKGAKAQEDSTNILLKVWADNLVPGLGNYFVATFSNVYHYVFPLGINHGNGYRLTWNGNTNKDPHFNTQLTKDYDYYWNGQLPDEIRHLDRFLHMSIVGLLLVAGTWGTLMMFAINYGIVWFDKEKFAVLLLFTVVFGVNFLGPVDGGLRYIFPMILTMPILFGTLMTRDK